MENYERLKSFDEEVEDLAKKLAACVKLKLDLKKYINGERKIIIVEGTTDEEFLKRIKKNNVDCIVVKKIISSSDKSYYQLKTQEQSYDYKNYKNVITKLIKGISTFPSDYIKYECDINKWELYGLVDYDYANFEVGRPTNRLLITDTHDLETMLLFTHNGLLSNLKNCELCQDDIRSAYFLAYQLATIKEELYKNNINLSELPYSISFSSFIEDLSININKLFTFIDERKDNIINISSSKLTKIKKQICENRALKKRIDENGLWNQSIDSFYSFFPSNFWMMVNGHDILNILIYLNENAKNVFKNNTKNRLFEMQLIKDYDYSMFLKTKLNAVMEQLGLVN